MDVHPGIFILIGIWFLPTVLMLMSRPLERPGGWLWIVVTICLSWLGWVAFALVMAED